MHETKDAGAFVRLLVSHQLRLYAYILSAVPNYSDADDVMQETSIALWEMFDQYRPDSDFGAWARSVARYRVLKYRERRARSPLPADDQLLEQRSNRVFDEKGELEARRVALAGCVRKLPPRDQQLLALSYSPKYRTLKQAAEAVGRSVSAVYKAVARIHRVLSSCAERTLKLDQNV
jgi:RNA polymerase sigma-70 factor (ECF subfamily)